jgi:hypothetical protein
MLGHLFMYLVYFIYIFIYLRDEIFSERNPMFAVDVLFSMTVYN